MKTYRPEAYVKALRATGGIVKNAAQALGCARSTFYEAIQLYPEVLAAMHEERETLKDAVEEKLVEQIMQGNMTAIIWYSKTQMKDRGYVERQESRVEHSGEVGLVDADEIRGRIAGRIAGLAERAGTGVGTEEPGTA